MDVVTVERLDHLGIIAGVIKDLGIIEMIDARIQPDDQEDITTGEAVAGMILNGLGFSDRPLSLTPQFFANKPVALLFRDGVSAEHFNRCKLGRSLDKGFAYGCDTLFSEVALAVCQQEGVARKCNCLDTTSFSLTGAYVPETDTQAIAITHGYSKDHRPDLKQAVLELLVSQDGGVPFLSQSWDGNASDTVVFKARCEALMAQFQASEPPRYLIADAKLYTEANASNLARLPFMTRIPETLKVTQQLIAQAWAWGQWQPLEETVKYQRVDLCHYGMAQRWLVVASQDAGSGRNIRSPTRRRKRRSRCRSSSAISRPNGFRRRPKPRPPWRRWPSAGALIRWHRCPSRRISSMLAKGAPPQGRPSKRSSGKSTPA